MGYNEHLPPLKGTTMKTLITAASGIAQLTLIAVAPKKYFGA